MLEIFLEDLTLALEDAQYLNSSLMHIILASRRGAKIRVLSDVFHLKLPNFGQFVKIWHYCTLVGTVISIYSIPSLKARSTIIIFLTFGTVF